MSSTKPGRRRIGREAAIQYLYCQELNPKDRAESLEDFWDVRPIRPEARAFAEKLIEGVLEHETEINTILTEKLENYRIERLAAVDRNILRLAIHEILHRDDIPAPVSINEAIEIAKRFGSTESSGFVNGLLDSVRKSRSSST